jgi:RNA polymerase sigma-70 factor (ECF subfamily)
MPLVYDELRRVAHNYLQRERFDHTLQSTAVVHEAYLRLVEGAVEFQNREHFFAVAAQLMRQILVDYARRHRSLKRDAGYKLALDEALKLPSKDVDLVDLDDALKELARMDARQGRIVELRFFGGLSIEETAEVLSISAATVERLLCLRFAANDADGRGTRQGFPSARFARPMTEPSPVCTKPLR